MLEAMTSWSTETTEALARAGYRSGGARRAVIELLGRQDCYERRAPSPPRLPGLRPRRRVRGRRARAGARARRGAYGVLGRGARRRAPGRVRRLQRSLGALRGLLAGRDLRAELQLALKMSGAA